MDLSSSTQSTGSDDVKQVQVRFVTTTCEHVVPDSTLSVPKTLARYGLSEIVNALTQQSTPTPYDFLVDGRFLRTDLATYLSEQKVSDETTITLEYVAALPPPQSLPSRPHPDWVSGVVASHPLYVVTACYDKNVRVFNHESTTAISAGVGHTGVVKAVALMDNKESVEIVSGSKDRTVRFWRFEEGSSRLQQLSVGIGHEDSVDAVAACRGSTNMYCSGGWDKRVLIWQAPRSGSDASSDTKSGKRRRTDAKSGDKVAGEVEMDNEDSTSESDAKRTSTTTASSSSSSTASKTASSKSTTRTIEQSPITRLEGEHGHAGAVSAVCWPNALTLYTGSWDHTIRLWDPINPSSPVHTWNGSKVVTSLCFDAANGTIISAHNDNIIRLWDSRSHSDAEAMKLTLRSHRGWVSGVACTSAHPHRLVSSSYDGTIKVWDIRASIPLHTINKVHADEKVLALDWNANGDIWSGGTDCKLQRHHQS